MKKSFCLFLVSVLLLTCGCTFMQRGTQYEKFRIGKTNATANEFYSSADFENGKGDYYSFTAKMLSALNTENALTAPLPLYCALGLVMNGAQNETLNEMENALGSSRSVNAFCRAAMYEITNNKSDTQVSVANSLWIKDSFKERVNHEFLNDASLYYKPEIFCLPFDGKAVKMINNWVYNNTNGKIDKITDGFTAEEVLDVISALYIKGKWINEGRVKGRSAFTNKNGTESRVLYFGEDANLYCSDNADAAKIYMSGGWSFTAVLPHEDLDFDKYVSEFDGGELQTLVENYDERGAIYSMPEFENDNSTSLIEQLKKLGIENAFNSDTADFYKLADTKPYVLYLSSVDQKANIKVNRFGLEGAAAIKIGFGCTSAMPPQEPLNLEFNRPFVYFVSSPRGVPLFIGTVTNL